MIDATAIVMTKNEEKNIVDCLKSMENFAKRVVVIDCGSTDETTEIAKQYGADVYTHEFEYYAKQFNWGIDNCDIDTEWIIRLDADERFPQQLNTEIEELIEKYKGQPMNGIVIEAHFFFLGRCMKHGMKNKRKMMLFKKSCGRIEDRRRDAYSVISEGFQVEAKNKFLHYDFKNIHDYINKYNWYATREMMDYIESEKKAQNSTIEIADESLNKQRKKKGMYYKFPMFLRAFIWYVFAYILKLGFLDGKEGMMYYFFECFWYRMLVDAKIFEYKKYGGEFERLKALD